MKEIKPVKSSVIDHVWYNEDTKILSVRFKSKSEHLYVGVPTKIFISFKKAKSKGRYFTHNIRDVYTSQKNIF